MTNKNMHMIKTCCLTIAFVFSLAGAYSQKSSIPCTCDALIHRDSLLLNDMVSESFKTQLLAVEEECMSYEILKDSGNVFVIGMDPHLKNTDTSITAILPKTSGVYTYPRNYAGCYFYVFEKPIINSAIVFHVPGNTLPEDLPMHIDKCLHDWLHVSFTYNNATYEGWITTLFYCSNPCSYCN